MSFNIELRSPFCSFLDHASGNESATALESLMMTSVKLRLSRIHWEAEGERLLPKNEIKTLTMNRIDWNEFVNYPTQNGRTFKLILKPRKWRWIGHILRRKTPELRSTWIHKEVEGDRSLPKNEIEILVMNRSSSFRTYKKFKQTILLWWVYIPFEMESNQTFEKLLNI